MSNISEVVAVLEQQQGWDRLFREIKSTSSQYNLSCKIAKLQENRAKNRYRDVSPFDHSRVKLVEGPSDYINSSLITMEKADRAYILTQGPLPTTSGQFWQMIWEQNSKAILMLNKIIEKGTRKCHQYWPIDLRDPMYFYDEGYSVTLLKETDRENFVIREFDLLQMQSKETRSVIQFHYVAWPDFGVPESPTAFLDFLACVRANQVLENNCRPAVVHCSAGIGRSGTFALVDTCLVYLEKGIPFDIKETLLDMRRFRMGLIQTPHQLRFSYFAIAECERVLQYKQQDGRDESDDSSSSDGDFHPSDSYDAGDVPDKSENHDSEGDRQRENRKRHGDPNGPSNEKREKLQQDREAVESVAGKLEEPFGAESAPLPHESNNVSNELRNRRRERSSELAKKVEEIKGNMKKSERKWPWKHYVVGGLLVSIVIGIAVKRWYYA